MINQEVLPVSLVFNIRRFVGQGLQWEPIQINQAEVVKRTKCHADPNVDVCIIEVGDLVNDHIKAGIDAKIQYLALWGDLKGNVSGR
jgi:hypothetical protein